MRISSSLTYYGPDSLEPLATAIVDGARQKNELFVVAVDGRSGAGKSTLAEQLLSLLRQDLPAVWLFHLEDMYQGWEGLMPAAAEWSSLVNELRDSTCGTWTGWDWETSTPLPHQELCIEREQGVPAVLIGEGVGAFCADVAVKCWVERPDHARKTAALLRDGETYRPFWDVWAQQENQLFSAEPHRYEDADFSIQTELN